jgi:hypothetical protein
VTGQVIRVCFAAADRVLRTNAPVVRPAVSTNLRPRMLVARARIAIHPTPRVASPRIGRDRSAINSVRLVHRCQTMVDFPNGNTMTNASGNLPERVQRVEQKLDALRASMDAGFEHVDAALLEQREYTEFAYEKLDSKMDAGFSRLDQKMDAGFSRLDQKMDAAFAQLDGRFAGLERKMDGRFARLERKIDQIVDLHLPKTPPDRSDSE